MRDHNIGSVQLVLLLFVTKTIAILTLSPHATADINTNAILIGEAISLPITFLLAIPIFLMFKKYKGEDILSLGIKGLGKGGYVIGVIYMLFLFGALISMISQFVFFMTNAVFPDASVLSILIVFMIAIIYGAKMGLSGVTRAACIISVFFVIMLIAVFIVGVDKMNFINLKPISDTSVYQIVSSTILMTSKNVEYVFLLFLCSNVNGNIIRSTWVYTLISFVLMFSVTLTGVLILGEYGTQLEYPFFTLASVLEFGVLQRVDVIEMMFWVVAAFFRATVCLIVLKQISENLLPKKVKPVFIWVIGVLTFIGVYILTYNVVSVNSVYRFAIRGLPIITVITIIPSIVLIANRKKRGDTK